MWVMQCCGCEINASVLYSTEAYIPTDVTSFGGFGINFVLRIDYQLAWYFAFDQPYESVKHSKASKVDTAQVCWAMMQCHAFSNISH